MANPFASATLLAYWALAAMLWLAAVVVWVGGRRESWTAWLSTFLGLRGLSFAGFGGFFLSTLVDSGGTWGSTVSSVGQVCYLFALAALVAFASVFPRRRGVFTSRLGALLLTLTGGVLVVLEVLGGRTSSADTLSWIGLLDWAYVVGCYLAATVLFVQALRESESGVMIEQIAVVATGILVVSIPWIAEMGARLFIALADTVSRTASQLTWIFAWPILLWLGYAALVPRPRDAVQGRGDAVRGLSRFVAGAFGVFTMLWTVGQTARIVDLLGGQPSRLLSSLSHATVLWTLEARWAVLAGALVVGVLQQGVLGVDPAAWRRGLTAVIGVASFAVVGAAALTLGPWVAGVLAGVLATGGVVAATRPTSGDDELRRLGRRGRRIYRERLEQVIEDGAGPGEELARLRTRLGITEREHEMLLAMAEARADLDEAPTIDGRFRIGERLGSGSFGTAYRVQDTQTGEDLVLKRLHRALDSSLPELQVARQVSHPNLVAIHEVLELDQGPALVMEHVPGGSVRDRLEAQASLDSATVADMLGDVLAGLEALHERGIAHGDLKPSNLLVTEEEVIKLADFGLASSEEGGIGTTLGAGAGTPVYLPADRLDRTVARPEDDLYAVGVIAAELLTGHPPSDGQPPALPEPWTNLVERAMAPVDDRFETAAEMRAVLPSSGDGYS